MILALNSCTSSPQNLQEEQEVQASFKSCQLALDQGRADKALTYFDSDLERYFLFIQSPLIPVPLPSGNESSVHPQVDQLVRAVVNKSVPATMKSTLTSQALLQRVIDRRLLDTHLINEFSLGRITVIGDRARAELKRKGKVLSLPLSFVRETDRWKIDLLPLLPYAELFLRLDRVLTGETETQQIDRLLVPISLL